ncbi:Sodium:neurotransmitter symporter family protein [Spiroplasma poulsonii]|nr:Sodium:neurotransmitter symporter family protein [Spiroplasma poulsonii]PWF97622.1 Sodium:neurotransmitter symporter family protein [Spiroplasma poulsonii]
MDCFFSVSFCCVIVLLVGLILLFGIKGIEKLNKFFMPLLFLIILILAIYILTVPGSSQGLATLFLVENLEKLKQSQTWSSVFSLAFFTTSLGMGIMMRFAGVLVHKTKIIDFLRYPFLLKYYYKI